MSITGSFQVNVSSLFLTSKMSSMLEEKGLMLATNVKISICGRTLSIAVDNSCGAGKLRVIRNSVALEGEDCGEEVPEGIINDPDDSTMAEALMWLVKGELSTSLREKFNQ